MKFDIVHVTWKDSQFINGWQTHEERKEALCGNIVEINTVGILLKKTKRFWIVALSIESTTFGGAIKIPIFAIKKHKKVGELDLEINFEKEL